MSMLSRPIMRRRRRAAANVVWQDGIVDRQERWDVLGHARRNRLVHRPVRLGQVDDRRGGRGTAPRRRPLGITDSTATTCATGSGSDLSFDRQDRAENVRRVAELALLFAGRRRHRARMPRLAYRADRAQVRELHEQAGLDYLEVYVSTSLEECARRDVKGLYARAERGDIDDLTGVGAPYEPPSAPDIEIDERLEHRSCCEPRHDGAQPALAL